MARVDTMRRLEPRGKTSGPDAGVCPFPNFADMLRISTTQQNGYSLSGAGTVEPWTLADLSVSYEPIQSLELTFAANNVLNRMPPADNSYFGTETQPYNQFYYKVYGRAFYVIASYQPSWGSH